MAGIISFFSTLWGVLKAFPALLDLAERVLSWAEDAIRSFRLGKLKTALDEAGKKAATEKDQRDLEKIINGDGFVRVDWLIVLAVAMLFAHFATGCKTVAPKVPVKLWIGSLEHKGVTRIDVIDGKEVRTTYLWGDPKVDGMTCFLREPPEFNFENFYFNLVSRCKEWEPDAGVEKIAKLKTEFDEERNRACSNDSENSRPTQ